MMNKMMAFVVAAVTALSFTGAACKKAETPAKAGQKKSTTQTTKKKSSKKPAEGAKKTPPQKKQGLDVPAM